MNVFRASLLFSFLGLLVLAGCQEAVSKADDDTPPDVAYAMRWWNVLSPDQMVASLYGSTATAEQAANAKMMYADLDPETKKKVNDAAYAINGAYQYQSVGAWWESLDCRLMRIAVGDGNTADPSSPYCAHYPGSGAAKILGDAEKMFVDTVGMALLGRSDPGIFPPDVAYAMRWWNVLSPDQMVASLYGSTATAEQATAAKKMYADLDPDTKKKVNDAAYAINGAYQYQSVGAWWESLDCRLMRIAVGDGNTADPSSPYCAHYPGSGAAKILGDAEKMFVDTVGMALLGRGDPGVYPPLNPPVWIHGTWSYCLPDAVDVFSWQFSEHRFVLTSEEAIFDSRELEKAPQTRLSEQHGTTWYRFDYDLPGVPAGWNRFDMTADPSAIAWTSNIPDFGSEPIPLCRIENQ